MMQFAKRYLILMLGLVNLVVQILRYYVLTLRYGVPTHFPMSFSVFVMNYGLPFLSAYYIMRNDYIKGGVAAIVSGILWGIPFLMNPTFYLEYRFILEYLGRTVGWVIFGFVGMTSLYVASKPMASTTLSDIILVGALLIPTMSVSLEKILLWDAPRLILIV